MRLEVKPLSGILWLFRSSANRPRLRSGYLPTHPCLLALTILSTRWPPSTAAAGSRRAFVGAGSTDKTLRVRPRPHPAGRSPRPAPLHQVAAPARLRILFRGEYYGSKVDYLLVGDRRRLAAGNNVIAASIPTPVNDGELLAGLISGHQWIQCRTVNGHARSRRGSTPPLANHRRWTVRIVPRRPEARTAFSWLLAPGS